VYSEDDLVPISALQHLLFCERQFALIHIEQTWVENRLTVQGRQLHERADSGLTESRGALRITRGLQLRSLRLGLTGRADVVEFHAEPDGGRARPFPVEYKRGKPKAGDEDRVQLCAQAMCLEEMLDCIIGEGALFYATGRRRTGVMFDDALRTTVETAARRAHELLARCHTPRATRAPKCERCSLLETCLPDVVGRPVADYMRRQLRVAVGVESGEL
jgi:CRISPR-associated exonuclease Cas4